MFATLLTLAVLLTFAWPLHAAWQWSKRLAAKAAGRRDARAGRFPVYLKLDATRAEFEAYCTGYRTENMRQHKSVSHLLVDADQQYWNG